VGVDTPTPDGTTNTGTGGVCTEGHKCPTGSSAPVACAAGTFTNQTGQASCVTCPKGYYCVAASVDYVPFPCPSGKLTMSYLDSLSLEVLKVLNPETENSVNHTFI